MSFSDAHDLSQHSHPCPRSARRDGIQPGKMYSRTVSQQCGDSRCFWVVQEQDREISSENCWGCSFRRDQALGAARSSRNHFHFAGKGGRGDPHPGLGADGNQQPLGQLSGGRTVQAAFAWEQGEPGGVTGLSSVFTKDKVHVFSTTRDAREEHFPSFGFRGKMSWCGAA